MNKETLTKVEKVVEMASKFLLPLAEQGVKMTKNPEDDIVVALFKGGLPEVEKKLGEMAEATPIEK